MVNPIESFVRWRENIPQRESRDKERLEKLKIFAEYIKANPTTFMPGELNQAFTPNEQGLYSLPTQRNVPMQGPLLPGETRPEGPTPIIPQGRPRGTPDSTGPFYQYNNTTGQFEQIDVPFGTGKKQILPPQPAPPAYTQPPKQETINKDALDSADRKLSAWMSTPFGKIADETERKAMHESFYRDALQKLQSGRSLEESSAAKPKADLKEKAKQWLEKHKAPTTDANINAVIESGRVK